MKRTPRRRRAAATAIGASMLTLIVLACTCGPLTQLQNLRGQASTAEAFATDLNVGLPTVVAGLTEIGPTLEAQLTEVGPTVEAQLTESAPTLDALQTQAGDLLPTLMAGLTEVGPTIEAGLGGDTHQWASQATASSEFGNPDYSASQATGAPDTTECGDTSTAWASANSNGMDWLQLAYDTPVVPKQIEIHQSLNPGAITQVEVASQSVGQSEIVYQADPAVVNTCPFTLVIQVTGIDSKIDEITITVDQTNHNGWDEIDAVELIGTP
jgi:hypothetical protein